MLTLYTFVYFRMEDLLNFCTTIIFKSNLTNPLKCKFCKNFFHINLEFNITNNYNI